MSIQSPILAGAAALLIADNFPNFSKIWDDFYDNQNNEYIFLLHRSLQFNVLVFLFITQFRWDRATDAVPYVQG